MWQRGRTSGIHSITNGVASFWSAVPSPGRNETSVNAGVIVITWQKTKQKTEQELTDFQEGAELHRPYRLRSICPASYRYFRLRWWLRAAKPRVRAIYVSYKTLSDLERQLRWKEEQRHKQSELITTAGEIKVLSWLVFTSGVSKMRLTCIRLVMCQVYLEKVPRGSPSFLTNAAVHTQTEREQCVVINTKKQVLWLKWTKQSAYSHLW